MNTMMYKGYVGEVEYDDEYKIFSGSVINTRTVITFQGASVEEAKASQMLIFLRRGYTMYIHKGGIAYAGAGQNMGQ